jgi:hypothetical protein
VKHTVPNGQGSRVVLVVEMDGHRTDPPGQGSPLPHGDIAPTKTFRSSRNRAAASAPDPARPAVVYAESRGQGITWAKPSSPEARSRGIWHPTIGEASRPRSSTKYAGKGCTRLRRSVVEDEPPDGLPLLGLYRGVPLPRRSSTVQRSVPDKISIFGGPITRLAAGDTDRLRREVRHVVVHEIAHHFGISDQRLIDLDRY